MKNIITKISVVSHKAIDRCDYDGAIIFIDDKKDMSLHPNINRINNKLMLNVLDIEDAAVTGAFSDEDALKVKSLIDLLLGAKKEGETFDILCSCKAGISRSPALAASLWIYLVGPDKDLEPVWNYHKYHPNRLVFSKMNAILNPETTLTRTEIDKRIQINRDALSCEIRHCRKKAFDKR